MNIPQSNSNFKNYYHSKGILGDDIVFCIVDSGVNDKEWLSGKVTGDVGTDTIGHGTLVAGITVEWCPNSTVRSFSNFKSGISKTTEILEDILKEAKENSDKQYIVNLSIIFEFDENDDRVKRLGKAIDALVANNIVVVCAAGNDNHESLNKWPAHFVAPICVTALQPSGERASFSSWDKESDVCELGVGIGGIYFEGGISPATNNGTSLSSPIVAGKLGLIMSEFKHDNGRWPTESVAYNLLISNTVDFGVSGRDPYFGYGFVELPCKNAEPSFVQKTNFKFAWEMSQLFSVENLVLHMSGTDTDTATSIHNASIQGGGLGCPYNYVIERDGTINVGRGLCYEGGHVGNVASNNLNSKSIGICLIGDLNAHAPTTAQITACKTLISYLVSLRNKNVYGVPVTVDNFYGHSTVPYYVNGKLTDKPYPVDDGCPGKYMPISEFSTLLTQPIIDDPIIPIDDEDDKEIEEALFPKYFNYGGDSYINVRTATKGGTVLTRVKKDERVVVLQEKDGWFELLTIDAEKIYRGWSLKTFFKDA